LCSISGFTPASKIWQTVEKVDLRWGNNWMKNKKLREWVMSLTNFRTMVYHTNFVKMSKLNQWRHYFTDQCNWILIKLVTISIPSLKYITYFVLLEKIVSCPPSFTIKPSNHLFRKKNKSRKQENDNEINTEVVCELNCDVLLMMEENCTTHDVQWNNLLEEKFVTAKLSQIFFFRLCFTLLLVFGIILSKSIFNTSSKIQTYTSLSYVCVDLIINWCFD